MYRKVTFTKIIQIYLYTNAFLRFGCFDFHTESYTIDWIESLNMLAFVFTRGWNN